jgi:hypothetical protein
MAASSGELSTEIQVIVTALRQDLKQWESSFAAAHEGRKAGREDIKQHPDIGIVFHDRYFLSWIDMIQRKNISNTISCDTLHSSLHLPKLPRLQRSATTQLHSTLILLVTRLASDSNLTILFTTLSSLHMIRQHLHTCHPPHIELPLAQLLRKMVRSWDYLTVSQLAPKARHPLSAIPKF